ncbi:MAG: hypothetical protein Q8R18_03005 [bacterium]|nr:hypothetical protein [bacterium]
MIPIFTLTTAEAQSLFAGTVAIEQTQTLETLIEYKEPKGLHLLSETILASETQNFNFGAQSPLLETALGDLQANVAGDFTPETWGYTAYAQDNIKEGKVRIGLIQDQDTLGAFVGASQYAKFFSFDADIWYDGTNINGRGYTALVLDPVYFSVGGDPRKQTINGSLALVRPHAFGMYGDLALDLENETQSGKVFLADKSTITRGTADFFAHMLNGTEMRAVTSGYILDSWAPFDANRTERFGGAVRWSNTSEVLSVKAMSYACPTKAVFVGLGVRDVYTRSGEDHNLGIDLEVYTAIPKTPLETWASTDIDVETRQANLQLYLGGNWSL